MPPKKHFAKKKIAKKRPARVSYKTLYENLKIRYADEMREKEGCTWNVQALAPIRLYQVFIEVKKSGWFSTEKKELNYIVEAKNAIKAMDQGLITAKAAFWDWAIFARDVTLIEEVVIEDGMRLDILNRAYKTDTNRSI
jgi:hypothetical protein